MKKIAAYTLYELLISTTIAMILVIVLVKLSEIGSRYYHGFVTTQRNYSEVKAIYHHYYLEKNFNDSILLDINIPKTENIGHLTENGISLNTASILLYKGDSILDSAMLEEELIRYFLPLKTTEENGN
tara:strand:- start:1224 stop:1607 length:384 start_codon:yes stop_codon:yes gene_type:complete